MFIRGFNNTLQKRNGVNRRFNWQTVNIDQVEIVKGPASILYGSVLPGGAVMSVSKKPLRARHFDGAVTLGSHDFVRGFADVSQPLNAEGSSAVRLIVERQDSEDYYAYTFVDRELLNPMVRWQPSRFVRVDLEYEYVRHRENQTNYQPYFNAASIESRPVYPEDPNRLAAFPATGFSWGFLPLPDRYHAAAPGGEIALDTDWYEGTVSVYPHRDWTVRLLFNTNDAVSRTASATVGSLRYAGGQYADLQPAAGRAEYRDYTTIVDATGRFQVGQVTLLPLVGGEYFSNRETTFRQLNRPPLAVVRLDEVHTSRALLDMPAPQFERVPDTTRNVGTAYGLLQAEMYGNRLRLLGGVRYEEGETNPLQRGVGPGNSFDAFNTQFGAVFKPAERLVTFLNVSESFVPNTIVNPDGEVLPLEKGHGWELGLRSFWLDNRLASTITVYGTTRDHMARLDTGRTFDEVSNPGRLNYYTTSGEERVRGFETELFARPSEQLELTLNYNWLPYGKVISFPNRPDIEGNRLRYAPRHGLGLWGKVNLLNRRSTPYVLGGLTHQSETEWDSDKQFTTSVFEAWTNVDAGVGWRMPVFDRELRVELLGKNLTDNELTITYRPQDRRRVTLTTQFEF
jgi:iron complex outermembrane receptor protein